MLFRLLFFIAVFALSFSCTEEKRCYESTDSRMVAKIVESTSINIDSLIVKGIDLNQVGDTIVHDTISAQSKHVELPLSLSVDSTGFQLFSNGKSATLYVRHSMIIKLISEDCGFAPEYQLNGFSFSNHIDSVTITDKVVNTKSPETHAKSQNVTIYYNFSD